LDRNEWKVCYAFAIIWAIIAAILFASYRQNHHTANLIFGIVYCGVSIMWFTIAQKRRNK
jgi:hypothetical protein